MKRNNNEGKFGVKKIKSMLRVFSKEWNLLFAIIFILFFIAGVLFLLFWLEAFSKEKNNLEIVLILMIIGFFISIILFGSSLLFFLKRFVMIGAYYTKRKSKYSKCLKVLYVYNEIGEKYNIVF